MRVGLLGGTFDPVHNGHLALASAAYGELGLDVVLFAPAGQPWRKSEREITPASHRLAMLRLAVERDPRFGVTDVELRREGPTYSADTVEQLAAERLDDELFFILGADALADLPHWHDPARIAKHAVIAVAARAGQPPDLAHAVAAGIDPGRIRTIAMPPVDVSSSDIRQRRASGLSIDTLVPEPISSYIGQYHLYERRDA
jgi:nicotinate-nucleotide adenylyltransferase